MRTNDFRISIPSGAIKRSNLLIYFNIYYWFQFLLVRLRVYASFKYVDFYGISIPSGAIKSLQTLFESGQQNVISIPSGAIKRRPGNKSLWYQRRFQFLLVRLRDTGSFEKCGETHKFQFLLVRLRAETRQREKHARRTFQFLLVRLREQPLHMKWI